MKKNILIVDDSDSIRELIRSNLTDAGFNVYTGINGLDALEVLDKSSDDIKLVITDLNMPVMDGIDLIKQLRIQKDHKYVPIIVLSTESQLVKMNEAQKAGATGWIVKPFGKERLLQIVNKVI